MNHGDRLRRLRARLADAELDALLVTDLCNVRYLVGFTGSFGQLLITRDGNADVFVTDGRYALQGAQEVAVVEVSVLPPRGWLEARLGAARRLGLEDRSLPWAQLRQLRASLAPDVECVPASGLIERLRQIKDPDEVAALARAAALADAAFGELVATLGPGPTEMDVAVRLDRLMVDAGAAAPSFATIVATGANGALPHHRPAQTRLGRGDLIVFDFGALVDGYHSDMTRVVALGAPAPALAEIHQCVLDAQAAGLAAVRAGVETAAVDAACRDLIGARGHADHFVHGTGHGIGLEIHEDPFLRPLTPGAAAAGPSAKLQEQMTVTVEPGVYVSGLGGVRIEDSLVVTHNGAEILTTTPKELVIL